MTEYYSFRQFIYTREQIIWAFENHELFSEGKWPSEYKETGYVGSTHVSNIKAEASFVKAKIVWAEIDNRLRRTGLDRHLVENSCCQNLSDEDIAIRYFMPTWEVRRRINSAVSYISSGPCPRWLNCLDCPGYSKCRRKKRVGMTYGEWKGHRRKNIALRSQLLTNRA